MVESQKNYRGATSNRDSETLASASQDRRVHEYR